MPKRTKISLSNGTTENLQKLCAATKQRLYEVYLDSQTMTEAQLNAKLDETKKQGGKRN